MTTRSDGLLRHRRVLAAVAAGLALATAATAVSLLPGGPGAASGAWAGPAAAPEPGAPGIGDAYFPLDGNGGINVLSYDIHDRYRFGSGELTGWTVLRLRATRDLSRFNLDLLLPVRSVRVDGERARVHRPNRHEVRITPRRPVLDGETVRVRVAYAGRPAARSWDGESNWLASGREVVTMNEPHMAAWWYPSNDHPFDKARMDIHIRVPKGKQVIANGRRVGRTVHRDGTATTHWRAAEPMTTYLAYFAAGSFVVDRGRTAGLPWYVAVSRELSADSTRHHLEQVRRSASIVRWLRRQLVRYPFATTGGVVTSLNPGFALENQTRPVYPAVGGNMTSLIVHELAHQWFGDSVSVRRWRDVWLNEGAATFMEVRWTETHGGRSAQRWLHATYDSYGAGSSFWDLRIGDPGPQHLFDAPVYYRGGMALQALRHRIGNADFWTTVRTWLRRHRDGNGSTTTFHALAEEVSGENLDGFFDAWFFTGEKPAATAANGLD